MDLADRATKAAQSFAPGALGQYLLTLPLAFIPFIGWALFVYINASRTAKSYVTPYLKRGRGLSTEEQREQVVDTHLAEFNSFGAVALVLEQIPIAGALFQITNFVGAALWVEKLDASREMGDLRS
jgi:Etoposide-induced protein 2.4 (EI24)